MKSIKIQIILLFVLVFGAGMIVKAQEKKEAMPNDQAWLQKFVGKWSGINTYTNDKKQSVKFMSHMDFTAVADGNGVYGVEYADDPNLGKMRGSDLIGYDPYEKKIHCFTVDNSGICHDHICVWKSPDHFYLEHNSTRDGKAFKEMADLTLKDQNTFDFSITSSLDGKITETSSGTYKKAPK